MKKIIPHLILTTILFAGCSQNKNKETASKNLENTTEHAKKYTDSAIIPAKQTLDKVTTNINAANETTKNKTEAALQENVDSSSKR